jgi:predicted porin
MKTFLITSTVAALLGAGSGFAGGALADETVELVPGGYFLGSVLAEDDELSNISDALVDPDSWRFDGKSEVRFEGVSVLDSGLRYGFRAEVTVYDEIGSGDRGRENSLDLVDEASVFLDGGFGRVEIGQQDGVSGLFSVASPHALRNLSVNPGSDDDMADPLALTPVSTVIDRSDDFAKITYTTPSFGGLRLGLSFTPDTRSDDRGFASVNAEKDDIVEFGVIYSRDFEALSLDVSATYATADPTPVSSDLEEWNAGVNVGFHGLTVGGSYRESENPTTGFQKYEAYDVGVAYETGPWKISAQFAEHEGALAGEPYENGYRYLISARYKVAKGLRFGAGFQRDLDILNEEEGTAFILESALKF